DHLRRVASEMAIQFLENTLSILQSEIAFGIAQPLALVLPAFRLIGAPAFVPAGEITVRIIFGVAVIVPQNAGGIRVVNHVLAKEKFVLDYVPDESAEKDDICSGPDRHPDVGQRARARKSWIDM